MKLRKFFGTKEFYKETMMIAVPIMAQQFVTSFVNLIDNVMIGSVGSIALTSVTVANKFYLIFNSTMFGLCGAAGIFISQYFGAKDHKKCQDVFNINLVFGLIAGLIFTLMVFLMPEFILGLFSKTPEIISSGLSYFKYIRYSYLPYVITMTCMMAMRSVGINKIQLKVGMVAVTVNTFLNYVLIFGHFGFSAMGVEGAALATLIARIIEATIYTILIIREKHYFAFDFEGMIHLNTDLIRRMMIKAFPLTVNEIFFSLGLAMVFKSYMRTDEFLVAAISVVDTVMNIAFIIFGGLSSAVAILIGNRLGANQLEEAKDNATKLIVFGALVAVVISTIMILCSSLIPKLYNLEPEINSAITTMLCIKAVMVPIYVINVCIFFILRAGGDAASTLLMDSGFLWGANVLLSTLLSIYTPINLILLYGIIESLDLIKLFVSTYFYSKGHWVKNMTLH